jgi:hypothetical protein
MNCRWLSILSLGLLGVAPVAAAADSVPSSLLSQREGVVAALMERARAQQIAESVEWRKLLHFESGLFGGRESQVDGEKFFLSSDGKDDPRLELEATLQQFFSAPQPDPVQASGETAGAPAPSLTVASNNQHALCRFPARFRYLNRVLEIEKQAGAHLPKPICFKRDEFRERLSAQSVTLVFSSFYLNNPSSAFGHSFLRIVSKKSVGQDGKRHELLDYGINYAAVVTTSNPLMYAVFGMAGWFQGTFTSVPYYYKVREYNDYEARDLWGYDLNLAPQEVEMLVDHLWELGSTHYDYFYFTENCSYHMFTTLEAAVPRLELVNQLPYYVIPSDTMRVLMKEPGLVTGFTYRPSVRALFEARLKKLTEVEKRNLKWVARDRELERLDPTLDVASKARIFDTALDYIEFQHPEDLLKENSQSAEYKQRLLLSRAKLAVRSEPFQVEEPRHEMPHLGHGVRRLTVAGGSEHLDDEGSGAYAQLGMRFALHDFLDPSPGYPYASQIEFLNLNGRVRNLSGSAQTQFELQDSALFRVRSLSPLTTFKRDISFRAEGGFMRVRDLNCDRCGAGYFEAAPGLAVSLDEQSVWTLYGFADFQLAFSAAFLTSSWRVGAGPSAGVLFTPSERFRGLLQAGYKHLAFSGEPQSYEARAEFRYVFNSSFVLHASATRWMRSTEAAGGLMMYW